MFCGFFFVVIGLEVILVNPFNLTSSKFPTSAPSVLPSSAPSVLPSSAPSSLPTYIPTAVPTSIPSASPTCTPTVTPTTTLPSTKPTSVPTSTPTISSEPTALPSHCPTASPTSPPSPQPTISPIPTGLPTSFPTYSPTGVPTSIPTMSPSSKPSAMPSISQAPTALPTTGPTSIPTHAPTAYPTSVPTRKPTGVPTKAPTSYPTTDPTTIPTETPTAAPTSYPTAVPTVVPTSTPTNTPTVDPSRVPTAGPTSTPTETPTSYPTVAPTVVPTKTPTNAPTSYPTSLPTEVPTTTPTQAPASYPTTVPTSIPTKLPTNVPTSCPSAAPTVVPTGTPTSTPTSCPTSCPSTAPTSEPTHIPNSTPTSCPTTTPSASPTIIPTKIPSICPSSQPTPLPSPLPSPHPSSIPSECPTLCPSMEPTISPSHVPTTPYPTITPTFVNETRSPTVQCPTLVGPPQLIQSRFTNIGSAIHFLFDVPTDRAGYEGRIFACNDLLAFSQNSHNRGERCTFLDDSTLEMTCVTNSTVLPGDSVQLLSNNLRTSQALACPTSNYSMASNVTILPALRPVEPIAILTVPDAVGACSDIVADAAASIGGGGRALSYEWSVDGVNLTSNLIDKAKSKLVISQAALVDSASSILIKITVVNFLRSRSQTLETEIKIRAAALPSVYIVGGADQTADTWRTMKLFANANDVDCDGKESKGGLAYTWFATVGGIDFASSSLDPRAFTLPAFSLEPGAVLQATVNVSNGRAFNYAHTRVTVRRGSVVASINGLRGAHLAVIANTSVKLDATTSYDQDNSTAILNFAWTCVYYKSSEVSAEETCDGRIGSNGNADLLVTPYRGGIFHFELTVTSMSVMPPRNDSTFVHLLAFNPDIESPTAIVQSSLRLDKVNPSTRLALYGTIMTPIEGKLSYLWSLEEGVLANGDLKSAALSKIMAEYSKIDAGVELPVPLVLESSTLKAGATYVLTLNVKNTFSETATTIAVTCNAAPSSGSITVSPSTGTALETRFSLIASAWADDDYPLSYTFYQRAPYNATSRTLLCATSIAPNCDDVTTVGRNQINAMTVDVADIYGATAISDPPAEIYVQENVVTHSVTALSNFTLPLLESALEKIDIDRTYQVLTAGGEAANELDSQRRLVACDDDGDCALTGVATYRAELLVALHAVIRLQDDDMEARARQASVLSILSTEAIDLTLSAQTLLQSMITDLASRTSSQGLPLDADRAEMRAAMITSLANLQSVTEKKNDLGYVTSFVNAIDDTLDALLIGATAGQTAESEAAETSLAVTVAKATASTTLALITSDNAQAYFSADVFSSDGSSVALAELSASIFHGISEDASRAIRLRTSISNKNLRRRRLARSDDILLTLPQASVPFTNVILSTHNVTAECPANSTTAIPVPCNGTNATVACNGTALRYNIECRTVAGPVCAEHNGTSWIPGALDTIVSSSDANITCLVAVRGDDSSRTFRASSNSAVQYYVSAVALTTKPGKLVQHPLLLWTFGVMTAFCFGMATIGGFLDRRDARRMMSRIQPRSEKFDTSRLSLKAIADTSMPRFVAEIRESNIFWYALLCIWRNHSILTVLTRYKPSQPRARRSFLVFFTCLMIMLSQVVALWLAFPTGYCESAITQKDCEQRRNLYYEVFKSLVEVIQHASGSDRACEWESNRAADEASCQLKVPGVTDIGTKRLLLVFLVFALSLPCIVIVELFYVKYACAPIWLPDWARHHPLILQLLRCIYKVVDPDSINAQRRNEHSFNQTADEDDGDDDDDYAAHDDFEGGAPFAAEAGIAEGDCLGHSTPTLSIRHRVGLRLWRNCCIDDRPALYVPLGVADYYALRAVIPVMKTLHLMRLELVSIAGNVVDTDTNKAIKFFINELNSKWSILENDGNRTNSVQNLAFAQEVFTQLKESVIIASSMENRLERLVVERRLEACALVVHLMRREHLHPSERRLLDSQIRQDGAFATAKDWDIRRGDLTPVTLMAKLFGQFFCFMAFCLPIWFMLVVATKLEETSAGKRTKRIIFVKTIVFLFFNYLTVEPLVLIIMRFGLPATLYRKLTFYEDPISLTVPYEDINLYVEASTLLSPIAAIVFAQTCGRIPIRLGPEAVHTALDILTRKKDYGEENILIEAARNEFDENTKVSIRLSTLNMKPATIIKQCLREAAIEYTRFSQTYPDGRPSGKKQAKSDALAKFARRVSTKNGGMLEKKLWASSMASDLYRNLNFSPPKSHLLLVLFMGCFLLVPPLARSILIREMIVLASFGLEIAFKFQAFNSVWRKVEVLDVIIVNGASEILFLWCSMALIVFLLLSIAVLLAKAESRSADRGQITRRVIRQRLDKSMVDHDNAGISPTHEVSRRSLEWQDEVNSIHIGSLESIDSLDGFILAGSNAEKTRRSLRGTIDLSNEDFENDIENEDKNDDMSPSPLAEHFLADINTDNCPITATVFSASGQDKVLLSCSDDYDIDSKRTTRALYKRLRAQAQKQILFGARELRGAAI